MSKQDELLKQAAEGELLLYVALRPFKAKLQPFGRTVKEPKQSFASEVTSNSGEYVPLNPVAAKGLCMFPDATVAWFEPEGSWEEGHRLSDHVYMLDEPQKVTREQVRFEAMSSEGLDVFKTMPNLTASKVTVRLLRKDEKSQPDRVRIEARGNKRTVTCASLGLAGKRGLLNREGKMLLALSHGQLPKSFKLNGQPTTDQSMAQAMQNLREIFRGIGIMGKDPFHPKSAGWQPRFKLIDAIKEADKRKAREAVHVNLEDVKPKEREANKLFHPSPEDELIKKEDTFPPYDNEDDKAGRFLHEHDNKHLS